jgi:hypothetical protein
MQLRPNDLPEMVEGETRRVSLNLSGAIGANTINSFTASGDNLTVASSSTSGATATFLLTPGTTGTHHLLCEAVLSSGETIKGYVRVKVTGEPCAETRDYE